MSVFDISFENKTLSKELQDYKVKSIFEIERLQDSVLREGLQDYKRGRITRVLLREKGLSSF